MQPVLPPLPPQLPLALGSKAAGLTIGPGLKDRQVVLSPLAGSVCKFTRASKPLSQASVLQIFFTLSGWHDPLPGLTVVWEPERPRFKLSMLHFLATLSSCVISGKRLYFSEPRFIHLLNGENDSIHSWEED